MTPPLSLSLSFLLSPSGYPDSIIHPSLQNIMKEKVGKIDCAGQYSGRWYTMREREQCRGVKGRSRGVPPPPWSRWAGQGRRRAPMRFMSNRRAGVETRPDSLGLCRARPQDNWMRTVRVSRGFAVENLSRFKTNYEKENKNKKTKSYLDQGVRVLAFSSPHIVISPTRSRLRWCGLTKHCHHL